MWKAELKADVYDRESGWYGKSRKYWESVPANMSGVLGGLEEVHVLDITHTRNFLSCMFQSHPEHVRGRALDCAAGIGRVTKDVLAPVYDKVDLLEPLPHMLEEAKKLLADNHHVGEFILDSMETVTLPSNTYDLIMIQWAVIYLTDDDFVRFFAQCKKALRSHHGGGFIVLKDNVAAKNAFVVDKEDSSLTRSDLHYKLLFKKAGLEVKMEEFQNHWPDNLLPVKIFALQ